MEVVGVGAGPAPKDGHHDPQAHHDLGRRNDQDEEDQDLSADVVKGAGECDEGQVGGVEHQLDAHEHDQHVAADQNAQRTDGEEYDTEGEVPGGVDAHASTSAPVASVAASDGPPVAAGPVSVSVSVSVSVPAGVPASSVVVASAGVPGSVGAASASSSAVVAGGRRARTTAPTTAMIRSAEVASKGNR